MASFAKYIAFFVFIVLSSSVQIQARESKFFSKVFHLGAIISPLEVPTPSPTAAPSLAPASAPANFDSQDPYYGLYGHGSAMFPSAKEAASTSDTPTTTATTFENNLFSEELADEKYESGYERNNYKNNGYTRSNYNNNGYTSSNYNNNGYTLSNYNNNGYSSNYNNNGYTLSNYDNNGYTSNYKNNGYEAERQGMSDTRFVEGGKYYYDVKNENYYPNGYESSSGKETTKNEGYYGNIENSYEFNSMEELQNKKDQYPGRQGEYVP